MDLIDRENHQKLYLQLYAILRKKIESGEWPIGAQIPTEEELCTMFNVSRATVRTAVLELVRQGYLMRQQGKGTFVYRNIVSDGIGMMTSLKELMFESRPDIMTTVLARTVMMSVDGLDGKLDISPDKHIIYIKRLRLLDNEPFLLQETYIPYHICPLLLEDDVSNNSLFDLFEKNYGIKITRAKNYMDLAYLDFNEGRLLNAPEGSAAGLLEQYFYSGDTLIMYTRSVKKPERMQFLIDLERKFA
jgi:DNA-binding GntR family transcriptional regulator